MSGPIPAAWFDDRPSASATRAVYDPSGGTALCRGVDPEVFFPERGTSIREVKAVQLCRAGETLGAEDLAAEYEVNGRD